MTSGDAAYVFEKAKTAVELTCIMTAEQIELFEDVLYKATRKIREERKAQEALKEGING